MKIHFSYAITSILLIIFSNLTSQTSLIPSKPDNCLSNAITTVPSCQKSFLYQMVNPVMFETIDFLRILKKSEAAKNFVCMDKFLYCKFQQSYPTSVRKKIYYNVVNLAKDQLQGGRHYLGT